jgi:hypothetical protein
MKSRKGIALVIVSLAISAVACSPSSSPTTEYYLDYPTYDSAIDLVDAADTIVRGRVLRTRVEELYPDVSTETDPALNPQAGLDPAELEEVEPIIITIATVKVTEVIKGDVRTSARIEVSQVGGQIDGATYRVHGTTLVVPRSQEYIFVLAQHPGAPFDLVNPEQGLYDALQGGRIANVSTTKLLAIDEIADLYQAIDSD